MNWINAFEILWLIVSMMTSITPHLENLPWS